MGIFNGSLVEYDWTGLQNLSAVTTDSVQSTVMGSGINLIVTETDVWIRWGTNPTASSTTGILLVAGTIFDLNCDDNEKVAVRAVTTAGAVKILPAKLT